MKKAMAIGLMVMCLTVSGCQKVARDYGGTAKVNLEPGRKLIEITWKDDSTLWYLTRPMRDGEEAEVYEFKESADFKLLEGTVIIIEREKE